MHTCTGSRHPNRLSPGIVEPAAGMRPQSALLWKARRRRPRYVHPQDKMRPSNGPVRGLHKSSPWLSTSDPRSSEWTPLYLGAGGGGAHGGDLDPGLMVARRARKDHGSHAGGAECRASRTLSALGVLAHRSVRKFSRFPAGSACANGCLARLRAASMNRSSHDALSAPKNCRKHWKYREMLLPKMHAKVHF